MSLLFEVTESEVWTVKGTDGKKACKVVFHFKPSSQAIDAAKRDIRMAFDGGES